MRCVSWLRGWRDPRWRSWTSSTTIWLSYRTTCSLKHRGEHNDTTSLFLPYFSELTLSLTTSLIFDKWFVQALTLSPLLGFHHSLRYLNVSANKLENLPAASLSEDSFSSLEELYVTNNSLTDKCVPLLTGHKNLRVLHLAYNQLQTFTARYRFDQCWTLIK